MRPAVDDADPQTRSPAEEVSAEVSAEAGVMATWEIISKEVASDV